MKTINILFLVSGLCFLLSCSNSKKLKQDQATDQMEESIWDEDSVEDTEDEEDTPYMEPDSIDPMDTLILDTIHIDRS